MGIKAELTSGFFAGAAAAAAAGAAAAAAGALAPTSASSSVTFFCRCGFLEKNYNEATSLTSLRPSGMSGAR